MDAVYLKVLFEKYASQIINEVEHTELMMYVNNVADEDLYALLWEQWQNAEYRPVFNKMRRERMLRNILAAIDAPDQKI